MVTITFLAPAHRSMAPPMPGTILPGMIQLARLPFSSTWSAPSTVAFTWPPRIRPKEVAESMNAPPTAMEEDAPPASHTLKSLTSGLPPAPAMPSSASRTTCTSSGR